MPPRPGTATLRTDTDICCHAPLYFGELNRHPTPQLSLVTVSRLSGRTGSDRMDRCVIDFNLESASRCCPPLLPFIPRTLLAPSRSPPPGDSPDCTATENTFKQGRAGPGVKECVRSGYFFPLQPTFPHFHLSFILKVRFLPQVSPPPHWRLTIMSTATRVSLS